MANIDTLIEALQLCILMPEHGAYCHKCPYASLDDCASELTGDTITALKRLKFLEKPTPEEQPELPGISKKPHKSFNDFLKGMEECSKGGFDHCRDCPYLGAISERSKIMSCCFALKEDEEYYTHTPKNMEEKPKPYKNFIDFLKGKEHCSQESSWTCMSCPYKNEVTEWNGVKSCCFALREDEEYYISKNAEE